MQADRRVIDALLFIVCAGGALICLHLKDYLGVALTTFVWLYFRRRNHAG